MQVYMYAYIHRPRNILLQGNILPQHVYIYNVYIYIHVYIVLQCHMPRNIAWQAHFIMIQSYWFYIIKKYKHMGCLHIKNNFLNSTYICYIIIYIYVDIHTCVIYIYIHTYYILCNLTIHSEIFCFSKIFCCSFLA